MIKKILVFSMAVTMSAVFNTLRAVEPETDVANITSSEKSHRVLVIGLDNNIVSNYFTVDMLADGTDIAEDSVSAAYNEVIKNGLATTARKEKSPFSFVAGSQNAWADMARYVRIEGDDENAVADLSTVNADKLRSLLDGAGASYLLVLDAHYMRYQEKPFKTLFHYVNYSLYDAGKKKLAQGSNYFTSINPQNKAQMAKSSRKSTEKIVEMVEKTLD